MKHNLAKYLEDVKLSIDDVERYVANINSYRQIEENDVLFDALCRRFAIIGEAIFQAHKINEHLAITDKHKIMGLRHIIVHDYDKVRPDSIWLIIINNLPLLKKEIALLLTELG